jgi:hypothetical protein
VLPSIVLERGNASASTPANLVAGREPVYPTDLVLQSLVQELNVSASTPAKLVASREPFRLIDLVLPSLVLEIARGECVASSPSGCAASPLVGIDRDGGVVTLESVDWPKDLMGKINAF